jgi:hypothetical protein
VVNAFTFCIFFLVLVRMEEELNQVRAENNNREIGCTRTKDDEGGGVGGVSLL